MRRKIGFGASGVLGALLLLLGATVAMAAITFHSGPTVTFTANSATATFNISGLGNDPAQADLSVSGSVTYGCANHGGNPAPGHPQTLPASGSGSAPLTKSQKNGRSDVSVSATLVLPPPPSATDLGCPNPNWQVKVVGEGVISATLTIEQPVGNPIFGPQKYCAPSGDPC
jgi:hypothetical protein